MKRILMLALILSAVIVADAQEFSGKFRNKELQIDCELNLDDDNVAVPGLEGLEFCYGHLTGKLNGNWIILVVKEVKENKAWVRMTCDRGNDAGDVRLELQGDTLLVYQEDNYIKCIQGKKYGRLPKPLVLKRIDDN